jgi:hypothetical protein
MVGRRDKSFEAGQKLFRREFEVKILLVSRCLVRGGRSRTKAAPDFEIILYKVGRASPVLEAFGVDIPALLLSMGP